MLTARAEYFLRIHQTWNLPAEMLPNFLIIGAPKAGTTSLHDYLRQHPQIFMCPRKDADFFAFEGESIACRPPMVLKSPEIVDIETYRGLFEAADGQRAVGEASVGYLYSRKAAERIRHHLADVRIVAVLRDPVDRAFSHFLHQVRDGHESCPDFETAVAAEPQRINSGWAYDWHYVQLGFYHRQLEAYYERFPTENIYVGLFDDFKADPGGFYRDLCRFLNVDDRCRPDMSLRHNVTGVPQNRRLYDFLTRPHPLKDRFKRFVPEKTRRRLKINLRNRSMKKPPLRRSTADALRRRYRQDLLKLQRLIERDLSAWLG
jgi:hypothetical protein